LVAVSLKLAVTGRGSKFLKQLGLPAITGIDPPPDDCESVVGGSGGGGAATSCRSSCENDGAPTPMPV
jgi:hypothetical protein